jgi:hypothetical protein
MVNHLWRLFSGHKKVSNAVRLVGNAPVCDQAVSLIVEATRNAPLFGPASTKKPYQIARIRTIFQDLTDGFGYKFRSHSDTSYVGLVRGLVVDATNAPILSRGICL